MKRPTVKPEARAKAHALQTDAEAALRTVSVDGGLNGGRGPLAAVVTVAALLKLLIVWERCSVRSIPLRPATPTASGGTVRSAAITPADWQRIDLRIGSGSEARKTAAA